MKKILRFSLRFITIIFALLVITLLVFDKFVQFRMTDKEITGYFSKKHIKPTIAYYQTHNRQIRYVSTGNDTAATILFIHGAPSSLSYWNEFLSDSVLLHNATMFAVDRPGYGYSGLAKPVTDIKQQAEIIKPILDSLHKAHHPVIIVGVSYGTSVACRFAMDYPGLVDGLVLAGPSLAPGEEKVFWFSYIIEHPLLNWFIPRMLQSANKEKVFHKQELTKMLPLWGNIRVPVIYIQGANDQLIYTTNAAFAKQHLTNIPYLKVQMLQGRGHLIIYSEKNKIEQSIVQMLSLAKSNYIKTHSKSGRFYY